MTKINKSPRFFVVFTAVICIMMCISVAELFSSIITVGAFGVTKNNDVKQNVFSVYAINLFSSETKVQASEMGELVRKKGGAGYIYQSDKFYVLASCYENKADAEKVSSTLKDSETDNQIIQIDFKNLTFSVKLNDQEKNTLNGAVTCFVNVYRKLYDLSVSVDTKLYTEIQSKVELNEIIGEFSKIKSNFETLFNPKLTANLLSLKLSLNNVEKILNNLAEFSSTEVPYTSQIKYTYFDILNQYDSLTKSI